MDRARHGQPRPRKTAARILLRKQPISELLGLCQPWRVLSTVLPLPQVSAQQGLEPVAKRAEVHFGQLPVTECRGQFARLDPKALCFGRRHFQAQERISDLLGQPSQFCLPFGVVERRLG